MNLVIRKHGAVAPCAASFHRDQREEGVVLTIGGVGHGTNSSKERKYVDIHLLSESPYDKSIRVVREIFFTEMFKPENHQSGLPLFTLVDFSGH